MHYKTRILILCFSFFLFGHVLVAQENKKVVYYPKAKKAVILGEENYQKVNKSLIGLKAIYIDFETYLKSSKSREMKMRFDVKKKVMAILAKHNIKLLDKKAIKSKFGQPTLKLTPLFPGFLGPYKKGQARKTYNKCCKGMFMAALTEGARTLRNPDINLELSTWKTMQMTDDCSALDVWFPEALVKIVEKLVKDKAKAEKTLGKKVVKKVTTQKPVEHKAKIKAPVYTAKGSYKVTEEKVSEKQIVPQRFTPILTQKEAVCENASPPVYVEEELYRKVVRYEKVGSQAMHTRSICDKVMTMDMEIFRTGSSVIDRSKELLLNTLVNRMVQCSHHRYVIETHADQRGSHTYNDKLTRDRANAIAVYLQSRGISSNRFETHSFGKRKPLNLGTTAADYSENRRVVITPHKIDKK